MARLTRWKGMDLPLSIIYTRRGSVPHLTSDNLLRTLNAYFKTLTQKSSIQQRHQQQEEGENQGNQQSKEEISEQLRMVYFIGLEYVLAESPSGLNDISNANDLRPHFNLPNNSLIISSFKDPLSSPPIFSGKYISIDTFHGRKKISFDRQILSKLKVDLFLPNYSLSFPKGDWPIPDFSSPDWQIIATHPKIPDLENQVEPIEPPPSEEVSKKSKNIVVEIDSTKMPLLMTKTLSPPQILIEVNNSYDLFDGSYPVVITDLGLALVCPLPKKGLEEEQTSKKLKKSKTPFKINLWDQIYSKDKSPLLEGCECIACKHHSKAYIHHLLNTRELLASVLLMSHNLYQYLSFFRDIRESIQDGTFEFNSKLFFETYE